MKKYLAASLGTIMMFTLSACSSDESETTEEETTVAQSTTEQSEVNESPDSSKLPTIPQNAPTAVPQGDGGFDANPNEARRMKTLDEFSDKPGTTRDGELEDLEAVDNVFQYFLVSTEPGNGQYMTQRQKDMFEDYVFVKKFKLDDKQKEELFDNARKLGMFRAFNEPALKENEKFEIIAIYLLSAYQMGGHENDESQPRSFEQESITFDRTGKLPTAKLSKSDINRVSSIGTKEENDEEGSLIAIRYKGSWFVSKQSLTGDPLAEIDAYDPNAGDEESPIEEEDQN